MAARTILITGCSSGIGYDAAHALAGRGWRVLASCRQEADCVRLRGEGLESFALDYADPASVAAGAEEAERRAGGALDALFNNGAFALPGPAEDLPREGLAALFEANLFGPHDLTRRVLRGMRRAGRGRIVNCSSVLGFVAMPYRGAYVASKFALEGLTDVLRLELREAPIHVVLIEPGPIRTALREKARPHYERWFARAASLHPQARWDEIEARLYAEPPPHDRFELAPAAVTAKLARALEAKRPRPRYYVTTPTHLAGIGRRLLPTRALDWVSARA